MKRRLVFLNSHPIQYFAPLYREIEKSGLFDLEVWYCSKHGLGGEIDRQFGTSVKWDIPLLEGYHYHFLHNFSLKPSIYGFWGLANWGIIGRLWRLPRRSIVVVHGWASFTYWLAFFLPLCLVTRFACAAIRPSFRRFRNLLIRLFESRFAIFYSKTSCSQLLTVYFTSAFKIACFTSTSEWRTKN